MRRIVFSRLLTSILVKGKSKTYSHGVSYLKKLDQLAASIKSRQNFPGHQNFKDQIHQTHHLKRGFWGQYDGDV